MKTIGGILALAALTFGSRALALAFLPPPPERLVRILERTPAPLFAGLAMLSLVNADGDLASAPTIGAAIGALVTWPRRSLALALAVGGLGYLAGTLLS